MNNDTTALKKSLSKGQILASSIAALLALGWMAFRDTSKQPANLIESSPIESSGGTLSNFTINDAKYIVAETRKLYNEAQQLMADEAWTPPANAFEANPVRTWKLKVKGIHDEVFSLYGYQAGARSAGTTRQLVVDALQRLNQSMIHYEAFAADKTGANKNAARELMLAEMASCESTLANAELALEAGKL